MSNLNSWEDDPAAQDENLAQQTQQMNLGNNQAQGGFRPGASTFTPGAASFQPGQAYGAGYGQPQYQQGYYGTQQQQGYYSQYGGQQGYNQYGQAGYGNVYGQGQGQYNQGYGTNTLPVSRKSLWEQEADVVVQASNTRAINRVNNFNSSKRKLLNSPQPSPSDRTSPPQHPPIPERLLLLPTRVAQRF